MMSRSFGAGRDEAVPAGPAWPPRACTGGLLTTSRGVRAHREVAALHTAIEILRTTGGNPVNLSHALRLLGEQTADPAVLEDAARTAEQAQSKAPPGSPVYRAAGLPGCRAQPRARALGEVRTDRGNRGSGSDPAALRAICQAAGSDPEAVRYAASLARIRFEIATSAGVYRWKRRLLLTWVLGLL